MKKNILPAVILIIIAIVSCKQEQTKKMNPDEIINKSLASAYIHTGEDLTLQICFMDSDVEYYTDRTDSVTYCKNNAMRDTVIKIDGVKVNSSKMYIIANDKLLFENPFEDMKIFNYHCDISMIPAKECDGNNVFGGYIVYDNDYEFKSINDGFVEDYSGLKGDIIIVKYIDKWGIINTKGEVVEDFIFDNIEFVNNKYKLYISGREIKSIEVKKG
jgi:hypothetical protein